MRPPRNQVFLEKRSYQMRRLGDAARLLPVLGLILMLLPVFWGPETAGEPRLTAWDGVYLFAVWFGLIGLAAFLSRKLLGIAAPSGSADSAAAYSDPRMGE